MHLMILDFNGTLTRVSDPVAFVERLKAKGYVPVILTGSTSEDIDSTYPGLLSAVRDVFLKPMPFAKILSELQLPVEAVTVVDDEPMIEKVVTKTAARRSEEWTFVPADRIEELA